MIQTQQKLSYEDAWTYLDQLQFFKIKLGLDAMSAFVEPLDNPHTKFPCIHIGGTNGKGSVGSTLLSILTTAGYKTGFYTSPHLSSVRERFRIGNSYISRNDFARLAEKIISILDGRQITYFEFTTSLAMLWFAENNIDLAIIEVGLGGRLDATNIVSPLVSIITNVSMDHETHLGDTIEMIASEKAGIIKPGISVITGTTNQKAHSVIAEIAAKLDSPLYSLEDNFSGAVNGKDKRNWSYRGLKDDYGDLPIVMRGAYQVNNAALALAALEVIIEKFPVSGEHIRQGLQQVRWPGRMEEFWQTVEGEILLTPTGDQDQLYHYLLDGAHNPDGAIALKEALSQETEFNQLILVWAAMADKDIRQTLMQLAPLADRIIFTKPDEERSAKPEDLKELLPDQFRNQAECIDSVSFALEKAKELYSHDSMICVAGSLYLVGKARQILCGELVEDA